MSDLKVYKPLIISLTIDIIIAVILVSIFRNSNSNDSFVGDVIIFYFVIFLITVILGLKNGLVAFLTSFFIKDEQIANTVDMLIKNNFPKPTDWYDIDNPEDYFNDVMINDEVSTDARIYATTICASYRFLRDSQKFIPLFLLSRLLKKSLRKYLRYCENN